MNGNSSDTVANLSRSMTMPDNLVACLRLSVDRHAARTAIAQPDRRVTYGELWQASGALASYLTHAGMQPGERVALLLENSPEYVAAYYGVLRAGGVVVALNVLSKARDLANWLSHSGCTWIVADAGHPELAEIRAPGGERLPYIAVGNAAPAGVNTVTWETVMRSPPGIDVVAAADAPAAIMYTSGTTGRPKGVTLSHHNLASNVASILGYLPVSEQDRCLHVLPFYYSYGNSVLHTHLAVGATLVLQNSMAYIHEVMTRMVVEQITGFSGVPTTYAHILARVQPGQYDLRHLRYLTQAGGAMAPALIERVRRELPQISFYVMYGQTEATARLAYLPPSMLERKSGSVGIPIPSVRLEIRDEQDRLVPAGATGEICVAGPNVMLGYWNDPAATAEVLRDGWLHTGDLGYRDEDGFVFIQGRATDMIKSGAHRIHPQDIEEVIAELEGVAEVAVVGMADEILGQAIKAVIVPRSGAVLTPMLVKAHCHARLASYKIPRAIEFATALPKTASGKVMRYQLSNPTS